MDKSTDKSTTYTVLGSGLAAVDAAKVILGYDDYVCAIKKEGEFWYLYTSALPRSSGASRGKLLKTMFFSTAATEEEAWEEIADKVLAYYWEGRPVTMTDEEYLEYRRAAAEADGE
jgi:hypothetical protein